MVVILEKSKKDCHTRDWLYVTLCYNIALNRVLDSNNRFDNILTDTTLPAVLLPSDPWYNDRFHGKYDFVIIFCMYRISRVSSINVWIIDRGRWIMGWPWGSDCGAKQSVLYKQSIAQREGWQPV